MTDALRAAWWLALLVVVTALLGSFSVGAWLRYQAHIDGTDGLPCVTESGDRP